MLSFKLVNWRKVYLKWYTWSVKLEIIMCDFPSCIWTETVLTGIIPSSVKARWLKFGIHKVCIFYLSSHKNNFIYLFWKVRSLLYNSFFICFDLNNSRYKSEPFLSRMIRHSSRMHNMIRNNLLMLRSWRRPSRSWNLQLDMKLGCPHSLNTKGESMQLFSNLRILLTKKVNK